MQQVELFVQAGMPKYGFMRKGIVGETANRDGVSAGSEASDEAMACFTRSKEASATWVKLFFRAFNRRV